VVVGIIGGTGFEEILRKGVRKVIKTPFGEIESAEGEVNGCKVLFIPRHGFRHQYPPHKVKYKANIFALRQKGVLKAVGISAAGAINPQMKPGDIVIVDQFLDYTKGREYTFYDEELVVHVDMTNPYSPSIRRVLIETAKKLGLRVWEEGTYVCTEGPRFETKAEIAMFRLLGGDVVGMTNIPEVILAREMGISYATIVLVTNFAAGIQPEVTQEEVIEIAKKKEKEIITLLREAIPKIEELEREEICAKMDEIVEKFMRKFTRE